MKWLIPLILIFGFSRVRAQSTKELKIEFTATQLDEQFELNVLRFYISNVKLTSNNSTVFKETESFHLIDIVARRNSFVVNYPSNLQFDEVQFDLGIDSLTNVSGIYSGDLDPTKGMYWTWQSGYINFKLEGKHASSPARNNAVQFHLGGYLPNQYARQTLKFNCTNSAQLNIQFDVNSFLKSVDFSKEHTIMSPGEKAVSMSKHLVTYFKQHE